MSKLVVEILDASDLTPKDGQGSANPYVEVEFDEQLQRTHTKQKDLNPQWDQKFVFNVSNPKNLRDKTVDVVVYNDKQGGGGGNHRNFLGRVRISGESVPLSENEASVQRYPLDKRGPFSHVSGNLGLRLYMVGSDGGSFSAAWAQTMEIPLKEIDSNSGIGEYDRHDTDVKPKKKKKQKEVRTFHSIGSGGAPGPHHPPPAMTPASFRPQGVEFRADFAQARPQMPSTMMQQMRAPGMPNPEFKVMETRPPVAARSRYWGGDKTASTYDLVERMFFLYVSVVKARDLPSMDISGSLDPYVEIKLGNYKGVTKHLEKNQNPKWNQIFAFSKERLQSNFLEIAVKDKDLVGKDDFVGWIRVDITDVPTRVPPDSPLAPEWYRLENRRGEKIRGEIMLGIWIGTQADEAFPEAWHSDAHNVNHQNLSNTRSKVYFSPKLYYLRVEVFQAQDLMPSGKGRAGILDCHVKVMLGNQLKMTRPTQGRSPNLAWQDELMFVASEPFEDILILSVEESIGPGKGESLGRMAIPVREIYQRFDARSKPPDARWYNLLKPSSGIEGDEKKKEVKFSSKICLRLSLESGYHVLDESTYFSSDFQPSSKVLRKPCIGILELGILSAKNLLPMKGRDGKLTDAYCVAKYGNKWVRTRTLLDTLHPRWNEQYTWEVHDPCTIITIGVFDNSHTNGKDEARDQRIGKVRVRLSTLETNRVYTHYYPLLSLQPSGLKKHGELQLALRFTCTHWVNMVSQYGKPLLPKMHYAQPIPVRNMDWLRHHAIQIVVARLSRAEPPLRPEVVEYMLDMDYNMFSLRRSKANFARIMSILSAVTAVCRWFNEVCNWRNPVTTVLVHVLFFILVCFPELILPTIFLYLFVVGMYNYRFRPRSPPHMDARLSHAEFAHPDELDEEFDTFPSTKHPDMVRVRYDRLRSVAGRVQTVIGDLATQLERIQGILGWRDPRASAIIILFTLIAAVVLYVSPVQVLAIVAGVYVLRHPRFRNRLPSVPVNFFKRLPAKSDMLL